MQLKYGVLFKDDPGEYRRRQCHALRSADPVRYLYNTAKYRAKKRGIEFTISREDLETPTHCPIFGMKLEFSNGRRTDNSYSLDRWDNDKGYIPGNVRIISWKANQYKGNMTVEQVESLLQYMKKA